MADKQEERKRVEWEGGVEKSLDGGALGDCCGLWIGEESGDGEDEEGGEDEERGEGKGPGEWE